MTDEKIKPVAWLWRHESVEEWTGAQITPPSEGDIRNGWIFPPLYPETALAQAREEGRQKGLREAKEIINNLTKNRTKEDFYPDAYDCRDAITRAAEGKK